jgi:hypothetical protein
MTEKLTPLDLIIKAERASASAAALRFLLFANDHPHPRHCERSAAIHGESQPAGKHTAHCAW